MYKLRGKKKKKFKKMVIILPKKINKLFWAGKKWLVSCGFKHGTFRGKKLYSRYIFTKYGYILHTKCIFEYNLFQNWPLFGPKHACFILLRTWVQVHVTVHKLCTMYMYIVQCTCTLYNVHYSRFSQLL